MRAFDQNPIELDAETTMKSLFDYVTPPVPDNSKLNNGNVHRAAANDLQAEKAARPAAPCATYCYHALPESPNQFFSGYGE